MVLALKGLIGYLDVTKNSSKSALENIGENISQNAFEHLGTIKIALKLGFVGLGKKQEKFRNVLVQSKIISKAFIRHLAEIENSVECFHG